MSPTEGTIEVMMSFCHPHWDQLRTAISLRGMDHLVAKSGKAAATINANRTLANFEPLIFSHEAILNHAIHTLGPRNGCPICNAGKLHEEAVENTRKPCVNPECKGATSVAENWINGAADDALGIAESLGLMKKKS